MKSFIGLEGRNCLILLDTRDDQELIENFFESFAGWVNGIFDAAERYGTKRGTRVIATVFRYAELRNIDANGVAPADRASQLLKLSSRTIGGDQAENVKRSGINSAGKCVVSVTGVLTHSKDRPTGTVLRAPWSRGEWGGKLRLRRREMATRIRRSAWPRKVGSLFFALLLMAGLFTHGAAAASDPQVVVRDFYGVLLSNMKEGRMLGETGRYAKLAPAVNRAFDIPSMTRIAVGPSWAALSPAQQQQLTAAFAHYVAATYADQFDSYGGEQLQVTGQRPYGADVMVQTTIVKSNGEATRLDYLTRQNQGSPQISDVYLDGSISQLAVHRSEFHSILQREGVDGLVMALNRKVDLLRSVARSS
jgi:phospholipid transport system substrate-binding protein